MANDGTKDPRDNLNQEREKAPLHRPAHPIDSGSSDKDAGTIVQPPSTMHDTRPGPDANTPTGQVSKM